MKIKMTKEELELIIAAGERKARRERSKFVIDMSQIEIVDGKLTFNRH